MKIEIPDHVIEASLAAALYPILDRLVATRVEVHRPRLLTIPMVAEQLACSRGTVYRLISDGQLETVKIRRDTRVTPVALDACIEGLRVSAGGSPSRTALRSGASGAPRRERGTTAALRGQRRSTRGHHE